jgi:hypothetical protein
VIEARRVKEKEIVNEWRLEGLEKAYLLNKLDRYFYSGKHKNVFSLERPFTYSYGQFLGNFCLE